jgi:hypothetical protein
MSMPVWVGTFAKYFEVFGIVPFRPKHTVRRIETFAAG